MEFFGGVIIGLLFLALYAAAIVMITANSQSQRKKKFSKVIVSAGLLGAMYLYVTLGVVLSPDWRWSVPLGTFIVGPFLFGLYLLILRVRQTFKGK